MAFDILIQQNASERIKVDKDVTTLATITGTLRQETSIIDPVFIVAGDLDNFIGVNYLTVGSFGRSYFANNIRSVRSGLVELTCHVDVLSSFAATIRMNSAIIRRQENNWNLYLNDGTFKVYQNPIVLTKAFPSGFTTQKYVLAVAGS